MIRDLLENTTKTEKLYYKLEEEKMNRKQEEKKRWAPAEM